MPFVAVFGLNVFTIRLPMAITGCASVAVFYKLIKTLWDEHTALVSTLFFAIYPWHIMKSRWALESNIFPDMVLLGCLLIMLYLKKEKPAYLYAAAAVLGLACYSYGTAYLFMPFFAGGIWLYMLAKKKISTKHFIFSALLLFVTVLPVILFVVINITDLEQMTFLGFTIPKMYQQRFSAVTGTGESFLAGCADNLKAFFRILINQGDGLSWNGFKNYGICYIVFVPLVFIGVLLSFFYRKEHSFVMHWWLVCALLVVMVTDVNVNRVNIVFIPVAYYISITLASFCRCSRYFKYAAAICCVFLFGLFCREYFTVHSKTVSRHFFHSYENALELAEEAESEKIYIGTNINQPYMLTLFYTQGDPHTYIDTAEKLNQKQAFEFVRSYDKYHFYLPETINAAEDAVYIVDRSNTDIFEPGIFNITDFEYYSVAVPVRW